MAEIQKGKKKAAPKQTPPVKTPPAEPETHGAAELVEELYASAFGTTKWGVTQDHRNRWHFFAIRPEGEVITGTYDQLHDAQTAAIAHVNGKVWER